MRKIAILLVVLLSWTGICAAQHSDAIPDVNLRYSAQISNASGRDCSYFTLQGGAIEAAWTLAAFRKGVALDGVADLGVDHTATINNAGYGLTLTTITFGPRLKFPVHRKVSLFGQMLYGVAIGSDSEFPRGSSIHSSATSYALSLGGGAEIALNKRVSIRAAQVDYLRTGLPNISSDGQNSLRVGAGITLHLRK
jgi:hypothetical protein